MCLLRLGLTAVSPPHDTPTSIVRVPVFDPAAETPAMQDANYQTHVSMPIDLDDPVPFGDYKLIGLLGRGGMGVVYRAWHAKSARTVAIKIAVPGSAGVSLQARARLQQESAILARIPHEHLVEHLAEGEQDGQQYFVMEYLAGGSLARRLSHGPLDPKQAAEIIEGIAGAVQAAHTLNILHRDIKPGNILLGSNGWPKLCDFGLARSFDTDGMTIAGTALGTPHYMAPEQALGRADALHPTADVYALGATLYHALVGRPPYDNSDSTVVVARKMTEQPVAPRRLRPDVPPLLEAICLKCLEAKPADRYATAAELEADLAAWRTGLPPVARPRTFARRAKRWVHRRKWIAASLAAVVLFSAVTLGNSVVTNGPVKRMQEALQRNQPYTLIGPNGPPRFSKTLTLAPKDQKEANVNTPFEVSSDNRGMIELMPEIGLDRYRIVAEIRHTSNTGNPMQPIHSVAGLYFFRDPVGHRGDEPYVRNTVVYFNDLVPFLGVPENIVLRMSDMLISADPISKSGTIDVCPNFRKVEPGPQHGEHWRKMRIDVTPDNIDIYLHPIDADSEKPLITLATSVYERSRKGSISEYITGPKPTSFRGGCGLFLYKSTALYRNVRIEPIPE